MKILNLEITIESVKTSELQCLISYRTESILIRYVPETGTVTFEKPGNISAIINQYHFQFNKIMQSALKRTINPGQIIHSVFIQGFIFLNDSDYEKFIIMDRRNGRLDISTSEQGSLKIHKVYADGSFSDNTGQAGFGGFTEDPAGGRETFSKSFPEGSSNLMELLAVTEGLHKLGHIEKVQINTDSRFVIRGLTQWVHFWRFNNWQTAYGQSVKYTEYWKQIDSLCENKIIEFNWIKGHSGHVEQDISHKLAQKAAMNNN